MLFVYIQYTFINGGQSCINMAVQVVNCLLMLCLRHRNGHLRFVYLHHHLEHVHVINNSIAELRG